MIYVTGNVDGYFVLLATWFFWLRVAHTLTHIFYNKVIPGIAIPVRTLFWLPSTIILGWMDQQQQNQTKLPDVGNSYTLIRFPPLRKRKDP